MHLLAICSNPCARNHVEKLALIKDIFYKSAAFSLYCLQFYGMVV